MGNLSSKKKTTPAQNIDMTDANQIGQALQTNSSINSSH